MIFWHHLQPSVQCINVLQHHFEFQVELALILSKQAMASMLTSVNFSFSITRYWLVPNTLGGMEGCPIHLSFDIGVPHFKMGIIFLMHSLVLGGGTPVAPGSILQNNTSHAVDRQ